MLFSSFLLYIYSPLTLVVTLIASKVMLKANVVIEPIKVRVLTDIVRGPFLGEHYITIHNTYSDLFHTFTYIVLLRETGFL